MYAELLFGYWKEAIVYKAEFVLSMLVVPFRFVVLIMIWTAVYDTTGSVGTYSLPSLITYFMMSSLVMAINKDSVAEDLEEGVKSGSFIVYLLQPASYVVAMFVKKVSYRVFGAFVEVLPLILIFLVFFGDYFLMGDLWLFSLSVFLSFIISYELNVIIGSLAFWLVNIRTLSWLLWLGIYISSGLFIPLDLFPRVWQDIFAFLPFQYIGFVPVNIYLGKYAAVYSILGIQFVWCFVLAFFGFVVWRFAIRRFGGVGT